MEEPRLLDSALRHWWVVLLAFTVTSALTTESTSGPGRGDGDARSRPARRTNSR